MMRVRSLVSLSVASLCLVPAAAALAAPATDSGYYVAGRAVVADHRAHEMDSSARPGIGAFVPGQERNRFLTGSLAVGHAYGNGWRVEGEYTLPTRDTYTSGSTAFPTSRNVHYIDTQRVMANVYRHYAITPDVSVYGAVGLGVSRLESAGWQGVQARRFNGARQNTLTWSVGAGVSYVQSARLAFDLGYRHVDMGQTQSGWNTFTNVRGLQDEMLRARVSSSEFHLGARYAF